MFNSERYDVDGSDNYQGSVLTTTFSMIDEHSSKQKTISVTIVSGNCDIQAIKKLKRKIFNC